jgi:hypothetical protein
VPCFVSITNDLLLLVLVQQSSVYRTQLKQITKLIINLLPGTMYIDGEGPYSGTALGRFQGLDLVEPLFVGGVPDFRNIHRLSGFTRGFVGK